MSLLNSTKIAILGISGLSATAIAIFGVSNAAQASIFDEPPTVLVFDTELKTLDLKGPPVPLPLGPDWNPIQSEVSITLSSMRIPPATPGPASPGKAIAIDFSECHHPECCFFFSPECFGEELPPINPNELDGHPFLVNSFFNVFFDISVKDVDPDVNFLVNVPGVGAVSLPDGASLTFNDNGPSYLESNYFAIFHKDFFNFGLIPPPEVDPYIGEFQVEIPLLDPVTGKPISIGGDPNEPDKIKFTVVSHAAGHPRDFILANDGITVLDTFNSAAFLKGAVVDVSQDPPFTIGQLIDPTTRMPKPNCTPYDCIPNPAVFGGPTTATSRLQNHVVNVPEPSATVPLALIGLAGIWGLKKKHASKQD